MEISEISLESCLLYENGRSHYTFGDKTSLIIHPNGDCFTYFTKDGKKLRNLTKYAINNYNGGEMVLDKLSIAL